MNTFGTAWSPLKGHHTRLGYKIGEFNRIDKRSVQALKILLGHPTGDGAGASHIDGHFCLKHLGDQFRQGRKSDAMNAVGDLFARDKCRLANQGDLHLFSGADRADGGDEGQGGLGLVVGRMTGYR